MLNIYHASDLETLGALACRLLAQPLQDPLAAAQLIVPSQGIGRWLTLHLASEQGIAMHLEMRLPARFIWDLSRQVLGDLPEQSSFDSKILSWRIYDWLWDPEHLNQAERLRHYLSHGDERRRFNLAAKIAGVFDQYLLYRDDWLAAWERQQHLDLGPDEGWQALLWRTLSQSNPRHRGRLLQDLLTRLNSPEPIPGLPERLLVFGLSNLATQQLQVFQGLARHTEVVLFALNPCREAWGDIRTLQEQARQASGEPEDWYLPVGNPLLASLGKQGRVFFDRLFALTDNETGIYASDEDLVDDSLLHALQQDVLRLRQRQPAERLPWQPQDRSLEIHSSHSPMREVEVLHDQLLARFAADPSLTPDQVVVLAPDIERYAPFVEAVFAGGGNSAPKIPFSLADRSLRHEFSLIEAFLALLNLPESRFSAKEVLQFLEQPAIAKRAGITEDQLPLLRNWLQAAGIRWARDSEQQAALGLPAEETSTWRQGLDRLLLGFAAPPRLAGQAPPLLAGLPPLDLLEGAGGQLLGALCAFVSRLAELADRLQQARSLADWASTFHQLLDTWLDERVAGELLLDLRQACTELAQQAETAGLQRQLELALARQQLAAQLEQTVGAGGFLTGAVTFCALLPMRSLPFRLICVLGLDDGALPRQTTTLSFDLLQRHPRSGDRNRRLDDRYLFLETLLSARDALYLSYVGRNPRDNAPLPPSVLISELLDAVDSSAQSADGRPVSDCIHLGHPLQPFAAGNFAGGRQQGFSATWFQAAQHLADPPADQEPWFSTTLSAAEGDDPVLDTALLLDCFAHPARYLLKRRLGLQLPDETPDLPEDEPFEIERTAQNRLLALALTSAQQAWSDADEQRLAAFAGLPSGALGLAAWQELRGPIRRLAERLAEQSSASQAGPLTLDLSVAGLRLRGQLDGVGAEGLWAYRLRDLGAWNLAPFWLRHLLLNLAAPDGIGRHSRLLSPRQAWHLGPVPNAASLLTDWIDAYREALSRPLPFFPKTSHGFAYAYRHAKNPLEAARAKARSSWLGDSFQSRGECLDPWNALAFRHTDPLDSAFESLAERLYGPALDALQITAE